MIYWLEPKTPCALQSTAYWKSSGAMHKNRIPTYPQVSCYPLLLSKTLNLRYRPLTMYPCYLSPLIYSCQLSISDNSFSDYQPSKNEDRYDFLCCLWFTSSTHLFWSPPIDTSWLTHVSWMHLNLPLSSMYGTVFRSYTVSEAHCSSFACYHQATPRHC